MDILKDYEKKVLNLMLVDALPPDQLNSVMLESEVGDYEYTGSGYFLKIRHQLLPKERIVCSNPIVIGEAENIICGFVVFIENNELVIECHSWGELEVTENFRNKDVQIKAVTIEDGKFVDLKSLF